VGSVPDIATGASVQAAKPQIAHFAQLPVRDCVIMSAFAETRMPAAARCIIAQKSDAVQKKFELPL